MNKRTVNKRKPAPNRPRTGSTPTIVGVAPVAGEVNQLRITFSETVIVSGVPDWQARIVGSNVEADGIISQEQTSVVLKFPADVSMATQLIIPEKDQSTLSYSGQRVRAGAYSVAA